MKNDAGETYVEAVDRALAQDRPESRVVEIPRLLFVTLQDRLLPIERFMMQGVDGRAALVLYTPAGQKLLFVPERQP